jgi:hypothetical protein
MNINKRQHQKKEKRSLYIYLQENVYKSYISSRVFLTQSLTFFLNAGRSSRHIIDASIFAAESQLGSLNIERTDSRMLSKQQKSIQE